MKMNNFNSSNSRKILGSKCKTVKWQSGRSQIKIIFCFTIAAMQWFSSSVYGEPLKLTDNGKTDYTIIAGGYNNAVDKMAVAELENFLKESTGATCRIVDANNSQALSCKNRIIVGDSPAAESILGKDVIGNLKDQESLVRTCGDDLVLIGGGLHGTLYAVYSFLENELGCCWYTAYRDMVIPKHKILIINELNRREKPAFCNRCISTYFYQLMPDKNFFFSRNRLNSQIEIKSFPGFKDNLPQIGPGCHTSFFYMNPGKKYHEAWDVFPKPPLNNLYASNPDFFSMNTEGKRVKSLQLCFSNPALRKTLTNQIEAVINKTGLSKGVVTLDANDVPGKFCYCPECLKLEKKYNTIAGPLFDYFLELCPYLKKKYPDIYVKTLAYRKKQSEIPPNNMQKLPGNLIIVFAPIDSNFAATLDHPSNQDTLENLKKWCKIAQNVWVWYYSNPYGEISLPFGNIEKMITDVKILKDCGVNGTYFEHGAGVEAGYNFAELQTWLFLKLFQKPDQDTEKLVIEFTDYYYGQAAPMVRVYIKELEELRKKMQINLSWNPSSAMFTFLTADRIMKWENDFDAMEKLVESSPDQLRHIRMCRVSLDIAMLHKWHDLKKRYPDITITPKEIYSRIMANFEAEAKNRFPENSIRTYWRNNLEKTVSQVLFQAEVKPKPLSGFFSKFPPENIRQAFPVNGLVKDKDAACDSAAAADFEQLPLSFGLYDNYNAKLNISNKIQGGDIKPDHYEIYKLGQAELTPQCLIWFTDGWIITVPIEQFYVVGEPFIKWDIYASLKFEGPKFGSLDKNKKNRVFCDRIILVRAENQEGNK